MANGLRLAAPSVLIVSLTVTASLPASAREEWWQPAWAYRAWFEIPPGRSGLPGFDVGVVAFYTGGRTKEDASDLRLVVNGVPTPHRVIVNRPGDDLLRVAFEVRRNEKDVAAYFGNPHTNAPRAPELRRGCLLETFRFAGGSPDDLGRMRSIVQAAEKEPLGADFVPGVFHGLNPFGPSESFVSRYTGWLTCERSGSYAFCTSSDDASFLLVDDALVVQWPGWHGAVPDCRFQGKATLARGLHKLEYLHVNGSGPTTAVAAWQPPGADRVVPIPPEAFAPVAGCRFVRIETRAAPVAAHFEAETLAECEFEGVTAYRLRLRNVSSGGAQARWDFGDGLTGAGDAVEHAYFGPGPFSIALTVSEGSTAHTVVNRIRPDLRRNARAHDEQPDPPERIAGLTRGYDLDRIDARVLEKLALLYKTAELAADEERVLKALVARPAEADDRTYFEAVVFLVNRWRGSEATRGNALRLLDQAEERLSGKADLRARVIRERGDVLFYYQRDLDRALGEYDKVVGRFADKLEDHIVRITKIRIGDVHRKKGEYERALASYEEAERFRIHTTSGDSSVRRGALLQQAETAIAHRNAELAASALDTLEWEYPAEKLAGRLSILRARAALLVKDRAEALVQLDDLVRVAPRSNEAAEALFLAAEIERSMGRTAEAMRRYERIVAEYKDSPRCGDARLRIKGTALPNGGN